jgi:hypothetical protein
VTERGQSFIDNGLSTRFVPTYPRNVMIETKVLKNKVYHIVTHLLYQYGHVPEKGNNVLKTMND